MNLPLNAWAGGSDCIHSFFDKDVFLSDGGLPSADPTATGALPFAGSKNASHSAAHDFDPHYQEQQQQPQPHQLLSNTGMARKRPYTQHAALAPAQYPMALDVSHGSHPHNFSDILPCPLPADHCHVSPPCDKPDCDESAICYDHKAHDCLQCDNDYDFFDGNYHCDPCDPTYACNAGCDASDFDFASCDQYPCPDPCKVVACYPPQHTQDCTDADTICQLVPCHDAQCNEKTTTCHLSDICPHKLYTACHHLPYAQDCQTSHIHCDVPSACLEPCLVPSKNPCTSSLHDSMSASTISTPHTDLSDANNPLSLLVVAAANQPSLSVSSSNIWEDYNPSMHDSFMPPSKRLKTDTRTKAEKMYDSDFVDETFTTKFDQDYQNSWHGYGPVYSNDFSFPGSSTNAAPAVMGQPSSKRKTNSPSTDSPPPEGGWCKWKDETTGRSCDHYFPTTDDFHNHVKSHTSTLVGSRGANRDYKCHWEGCEKSAPFGTKNHLDRHMQNHTGYKPFACDHANCTHRCVTQQQLNNHKTTHTGKKPFVCDHPGCGKTFSVKTALSTHKRIHTNDKPFTCKFCGDKYADSSNLSKHRKTVHEDERTSIPCPDPSCTYRDSRCQRLERHCRDCGHGAEMYSDPMKWAEYTGKWKRKPPATSGPVGNARSRTGSVVTRKSSVSIGAAA